MKIVKGEVRELVAKKGFLVRRLGEEVGYKRYIMFEDDSIELFEEIQEIEQVKEDDSSY